MQVLSQTDEVLQQLFQNNFIVLQIFDDIINAYCDVDDSDRIDSKSKINVLLMKKEVVQNFEVLETLNHDIPTENSTCAIALKPDQVIVVPTDDFQTEFMIRETDDKRVRLALCDTNLPYQPNRTSIDDGTAENLLGKNNLGKRKVFTINFIV